MLAEPSESPKAYQTLQSLLVARKWSVAAVTALVVASALYYSAQETPIYSSQAIVLVRIPQIEIETGPTDTVPVLGGLNMETERELAESEAVARVAKDQLETSETPLDLLTGLVVSFSQDSEVLTIEYEHQDPEVARARASAFSRGYLTYRERQVRAESKASAEVLQREVDVIENRLLLVNQQIAARSAVESDELSALQSQANLIATALIEKEIARAAIREDQSVGTVIQSATLPPSPISPNHLVNGLLALMLGLALGAAQAILRGRLDRRIRTVDDLETLLNSAVLAAIPRIPAWTERKGALALSGHRSARGAEEAYRVLRSNFLAAASVRRLKSVMVTSARPGEGKTTTAANLALALAQAGRMTALVSADLRRPQIDDLFNVGGSVGLSDVLRERSTLEKALVRTTVSEDLVLLPAGSHVDNPAELLSSDAMADVLARLAAACDFVIVDTLQITTTADAIALAPLMDAALFVTDQQSMSRGRLIYIRRQLAQLSTPIMGIVLNKFEPSKDDSYAYYEPAYLSEDARWDVTPADT